MIKSIAPDPSKPVMPGRPDWRTGGIAPEEERGLPLSEVRRRIVAVAERHRLTGETLDVALVRLLTLSRDNSGSHLEHDSFILTGEYLFWHVLDHPLHPVRTSPWPTFERLLRATLRRLERRVDELMATGTFETREHACIVAFYTEGNLIAGWLKVVPEACKQADGE